MKILTPILLLALACISTPQAEDTTPVGERIPDDPILALADVRTDVMDRLSALEPLKAEVLWFDYVRLDKAPAAAFLLGVPVSEAATAAKLPGESAGGALMRLAFTSEDEIELGLLEGMLSGIEETSLEDARLTLRLNRSRVETELIGVMSRASMAVEALPGETDDQLQLRKAEAAVEALFEALLEDSN